MNYVGGVRGWGEGGEVRIGETPTPSVSSPTWSPGRRSSSLFRSCWRWWAVRVCSPPRSWCCSGWFPKRKSNQIFWIEAFNNCYPGNLHKLPDDVLPPWQKTCVHPPVECLATNFWDLDFHLSYPFWSLSRSCTATSSRLPWCPRSTCRSRCPGWEHSLHLVSEGSVITVDSGIGNRKISPRMIWTLTVDKTIYPPRIYFLDIL